MDARWWMAAVVAWWCGVGATGLARAADSAEVAAAKQTFDASEREFRKVVSDMTVLQAQYHQPGADKAAIEARFKEVSTSAVAARERQEAAALQLALLDPANRQAREVMTSVIKGAIRADAPEIALDKARQLEAAGVTDSDLWIMAAEAAWNVSLLDEARDWLAKARAAGGRKDLIDKNERLIDHDRLKVDEEMAKRKADAEADTLPRVRISTTAGDVVVELFEDIAPNTVANFISLIEKGFYDGTPFHRVIPGFMAQGGDPKGTGSGGPGYTIACEVDAPGARKHFRGTLSMAHAGRDTGGSQFFLTFRPTEHLDGKHTVFGRVIEGFEVLSMISRTNDEQGRELVGIEPDRITKVEILRKRNHPYVPKTQPDASTR